MITRRKMLGGLAAAPFLPTLAAAQAGIAGAPFQVRDGRMWMPVSLGEQGPFPFVLDTGGYMNLIDPQLAGALGLRLEGSVVSRGVGGTERMRVHVAPDVRLGLVRVGAIRFAAFEQVAGIHPAARGALSAGLVTVADADLDFDAGEWRLHLDGRADRSGFERLPSRISGEGPGAGADHILVDVAIDGQDFRLTLDTGAPGTIVLAPGATRRLGLWNDRTPFSPHRRAGIGGDGGAARIVRAGEVRIGSTALARPLLSLTDPAAAYNLRHDGLLGLGMIELFNLSTDVRRRALWARRNRREPRPERYGMSGFWLEQRRGGLVVAALSPGSPAAEAGLRVGDAILGGTLQDWIGRLSGRPGETVEIPFSRDGESRTTRLTLREYL